MPKSTHFHVLRDAAVTDKKFRPDDEAIYEEEKQEFRSSEKEKKAEPMTENEFVMEQDKRTEEAEK